MTRPTWSSHDAVGGCRPILNQMKAETDLNCAVGHEVAHFKTWLAILKTSVAANC